MWIIINKKGDMVNTEKLVAIQRDPEDDGGRIRFSSEVINVWSDELSNAKEGMSAIISYIAMGKITCDLTPEFAASASLKPPCMRMRA